jgi:hypothetical protein
VIPRRGRALALTLLLLALPGRPLLAQATFYEAYHAGLEHLDAGRWEAARTALLRAAELRPQAGRRVKTYGLNFLPVYEPYLPLAEAEAHLGLLDPAEAHLRRARADGVAPAGRVEALAARLAAQRSPEVPREAAAPTPAPPVPSTARPEESPAGAVAAPPESRPVETVQAQAPDKGAAIQEKPSGEPAQTSPAPQPGRQSAAREPAPPLRQDRPAEPEPASPRRDSTAGEPTPGVAATPRQDGAATVPPQPPAWPWIGGIGAALLALAGAAAVALRRRPAAAPEAEPPPARSAPAAITDERTVGLTRPKPLPDGVSPDFGAYRLEGVLGAGGMARTFLGTRVRDGLRVAIKVPHDHLLADEEGVARFLREGELGATLHHPNIVRIFEAGEHRGHPFLAMEFLQGPTLEEFLRAQGPLAVRPALEIARGIAVALDYAHLKGVIHRDLKPENVILAEGMQVKVMDYGIARVLGAPGLTAPQTYLGTPLYSAPEAIDPPEVDHQSDLYSLGIVLYRMLAGAPPFVSTNPFELFTLHRTSPLPPFSAERGIPAEAVALVSRLTAKEKRDRYPGAELLLRDLDRLLNAL